MVPTDSVAVWLQGLRDGDPAAAQRLWERYFDRLLQLVAHKLPSHARRVFDEEDVALSTMRSCFAAIADGRYPQLVDRDSLWNLLVVSAARKAHSYVRRQRQARRGGGEVRGESAFAAPQGDDSPGGIEQVIGDEPTPEFAAQVAEECRYLLAALEEESLRSIALLKMEGWTVEEIATRLGCARRTVERRLQMIRTRWQEVMPAAAEA